MRDLNLFFQKESIDKRLFEKPIARSTPQDSSHTSQESDAAIFIQHEVNVLSYTLINQFTVPPDLQYVICFMPGAGNSLTDAIWQTGDW